MEIQGKGKTIMKNNMQCGHTIPDFKNYYQPIEIKKIKPCQNQREPMERNADSRKKL